MQKICAYKIGSGTIYESLREAKKAELEDKILAGIREFNGYIPENHLTFLAEKLPVILKIVKENIECLD